MISLKLVTSAELDRVVQFCEHPADPACSLSADHPLYPEVADNVNAMPIRSVVASLRAHFDVFGVLETPYRDLEFWDAYIGFYAEAFKPYPLNCKRVHFFSGDHARAQELVEAILAGHSPDEPRGTGLPHHEYRGYLVLRPLSSFCVARAAVTFDETPCGQKPGIPVHPAETNTVPYCTARQKCSVNLLNGKFCISTPEFIQQDPNIGVCATASVWVSSNLMHSRFKTNRFGYRTITRQALGGSPGNPQASMFQAEELARGLSTREMKTALRATGAGTLDTRVATPGQDPKSALWSACHFTYSMVESEIPVLLCTSGPNGENHVVVAVGHALPQRVDLTKAEPIAAWCGNARLTRHRHYAISSLVRLYYAHDDSYGPFNRIHFAEGRSPSCRDRIRGKTLPKVVLDVGRDRSVRYLQEIVSPVPPMVRHGCMGPLEHVISVVEKYADAFSDTIPAATAFVWRSLLIEGAEFKRSVPRRGYSDELRAWYAQMHLPKYVWLYEFTLVHEEDQSDWLGISGDHRVIHGEFLYDATTPEYDVSCVCWRILAVRCAKDQQSISVGKTPSVVAHFTREDTDHGRRPA